MAGDDRVRPDAEDAQVARPLLVVEVVESEGTVADQQEGDHDAEHPAHGAGDIAVQLSGARALEPAPQGAVAPSDQDEEGEGQPEVAAPLEDFLPYALTCERSQD